MTWKDIVDSVNAAIDAAEAWIVGQSFWVQVPLLLVVLLPLLWLLAGQIDRVVDRVLEPHSRREARLAAAHPAGRGRRQPEESE